MMYLHLVDQYLRAATKRVHNQNLGGDTLRRTSLAA